MSFLTPDCNLARIAFAGTFLDHAAVVLLEYMLGAVHPVVRDDGASPTDAIHHDDALAVVKAFV